jgi:cytochrome c-type biogenesis protein CcmH
MSGTSLTAGASLLLVTVLLAGAGAVTAQTLEDRVREMAGLLMCPVCEGQTVAESSSELAAQMRGVIREKLAEGQDREQILEYFVLRYGESILAAPPKRGFALLVWIGPLAVLLGGLGLAVGTLRRWTRPPSPTSV